MQDFPGDMGTLNLPILVLTISIHISGKRSVQEYTNLETKHIRNTHHWLTHYELPTLQQLYIS